MQSKKSWVGLIVLVIAAVVLISVVVSRPRSKIARTPVTISERGALVRPGSGCRLGALDMPTYWAQMSVTSKRRLFMTADQIQCCDPKIKVGIIDAKRSLRGVKVDHGDQVNNLLCSQHGCSIADKRGVDIWFRQIIEDGRFGSNVFRDIEDLAKDGNRVVNLSLAYIAGSKNKEASFFISDNVVRKLGIFMDQVSRDDQMVIVWSAGNEDKDIKNVAKAWRNMVFVASGAPIRHIPSYFSSLIPPGLPGFLSMSDTLIYAGDADKLFGGTSGAAPVVSGAFVQVFKAHPELTASQARLILEATTRDVLKQGYDTYSGFGMPNIPLAVYVATEIKEGRLSPFETYVAKFKDAPYRTDNVIKAEDAVKNTIRQYIMAHPPLGSHRKAFYQDKVAYYEPEKIENEQDREAYKQAFFEMTDHCDEYTDPGMKLLNGYYLTRFTPEEAKLDGMICQFFTDQGNHWGILNFCAQSEKHYGVSAEVVCQKDAWDINKDVESYLEHRFPKLFGKEIRYFESFHPVSFDPNALLTMIAVSDAGSKTDDPLSWYTHVTWLLEHGYVQSAVKNTLLQSWAKPEKAEGVDERWAQLVTTYVVSRLSIRDPRKRNQEDRELVYQLLNASFATSSEWGAWLKILVDKGYRLNVVEDGLSLEATYTLHKDVWVTLFEDTLENKPWMVERYIIHLPWVARIDGYSGWIDRLFEKGRGDSVLFYALLSKPVMEAHPKKWKTWMERSIRTANYPSNIITKGFVDEWVVSQPDWSKWAATLLSDEYKTQDPYQFCNKVLGQKHVKEHHLNVWKQWVEEVLAQNKDFPVKMLCDCVLSKQWSAQGNETAWKQWVEKSIAVLGKPEVEKLVLKHSWAKTLFEAE